MIPSLSSKEGISLVYNCCMPHSGLRIYIPVGWKHLAIWLLSFILLTACQGNVESTPTLEVYRPPTQVVTETPIKVITPEVEVDRPTSEPACTDDLWFFQDLTIPDGTQVSPGERLDKRWLVQNAGTCNWDERYQVRLEAGPNMGAPALQSLFPARSGVELIIRMIFIAPDEPGIYRSAWQAYDPNDQAFGDPFFIEIEVIENSSSESSGGE